MFCFFTDNMYVLLFIQNSLKPNRKAICELYLKRVNNLFLELCQKSTQIEKTEFSRSRKSISSFKKPISSPEENRKTTLKQLYLHLMLFIFTKNR